MARTSLRAERVADAIQRELSQLLQRELDDPRLALVNVHEVRVSADLGYADVYFTRIGTTEDAERREVEEALRHAAGFLRKALGERIRLRSVPRLRFHYDLLPEKSAALEQLIDRAIAEDAAREDRDGDEGGTP